jgi:hypothetical protein
MEAVSLGPSCLRVGEEGVLCFVNSEEGHKWRGKLRRVLRQLHFSRYAVRALQILIHP